jgi:hypothetical protein
MSQKLSIILPGINSKDYYKTNTNNLSNKIIFNETNCVNYEDLFTEDFCNFFKEKDTKLANLRKDKPHLLIKDFNDVKEYTKKIFDEISKEESKYVVTYYKSVHDNSKICVYENSTFESNKINDKYYYNFTRFHDIYFNVSVISTDNIEVTLKYDGYPQDGTLRVPSGIQETTTLFIGKNFKINELRTIVMPYHSLEISSKEPFKIVCQTGSIVNNIIYKCVKERLMLKIPNVEDLEEIRPSEARSERYQEEEILYFYSNKLL